MTSPCITAALGSLVIGDSTIVFSEVTGTAIHQTKKKLSSSLMKATCVPLPVEEHTTFYYRRCFTRCSGQTAVAPDRTEPPVLGTVSPRTGGRHHTASRQGRHPCCSWSVTCVVGSLSPIRPSRYPEHGAASTHVTLDRSHGARDGRTHSARGRTHLSTAGLRSARERNSILRDVLWSK